jgi:phenylacetate-coenzyme A ligase PaaK-like adenylate-forming protein
MHRGKSVDTVAQNSEGGRGQPNARGADDFTSRDWLLHLKSDFIRLLVFPVLQKRWHPRARRYFTELRKYEFAPLKDVQTAQWERLQSVVRYAAQHVPYYRNLFREHGLRADQIRSPQDYLRVPVLTKATLQQKLSELVADDRDKKKGHANASGGSTGKPVQFFQDAEYWDRAFANQWFVDGWWGIRPGDRTAWVWGADRDIPDQSWRERLYGAISQVRMCNAFALAEPQMDSFAKMLTVWKPRYVIAYASALEVFAKFLLERPHLHVRAHAIKTTADVLGEGRREIIEKAFGCPVYNFYGCREINNLAAECPARQGLHVSSLTRYIEVVDDAGNPVPPGVPGRLLLTDLTNYFQPFLRYEIEDIGSWKQEPCSCGRPFPVLEQVWGRSSDFIVTPAGKLIHSVFFTHLFYDMPEVALFQINQKELREVDVYLVLRPDVSTYPAELLRQRLKETFGPSVRVVVQVVSEIERPPSGKHRFTVSKVRAPWNQSQVSAEMDGAAVS